VWVEVDQVQARDGDRVAFQRGPADLRTVKHRSSSTYSMTEPPSQPEKRTAFLMMLDSTSSSTRLEPTIWPTSLKASICSTRRTSSALRSSSALTRWTLWTTTAACAANTSSSASSRSSKGSTSMRNMEMPPTTSPSSSIVADIELRMPPVCCTSLRMYSVSVSTSLTF
jgi:hypothetical protein